MLAWCRTFKNVKKKLKNNGEERKGGMFGDGKSMLRDRGYPWSWIV